jgi:hypothetical protein
MIKYSKERATRMNDLGNENFSNQNTLLGEPAAKADNKFVDVCLVFLQCDFKASSLKSAAFHRESKVIFS